MTGALVILSLNLKNFPSLLGNFWTNYNTIQCCLLCFLARLHDSKTKRHGIPLLTLAELLYHTYYFVGINIVRKALKIPCYQIASNAGVDANEIVNRVVGEKAEVGYDALNGEFVDMISAGIIDPTKVRAGAYGLTLLLKPVTLGSFPH